MPEDRPVNRCAVKGCAYVGYWPRDGFCPSHRDEHPPRLPSVAEVLGEDCR